MYSRDGQTDEKVQQRYYTILGREGWLIDRDWKKPAQRMEELIIKSWMGSLQVRDRRDSCAKITHYSGWRMIFWSQSREIRPAGWRSIYLNETFEIWAEATKYWGQKGLRFQLVCFMLIGLFNFWSWFTLQPVPVRVIVIIVGIWWTRAVMGASTWQQPWIQGKSADACGYQVSI